MVPSSTVHFSCPTSIQPLRSWPLNSLTHCSLGNFIFEFWAAASVAMSAIESIKRIFYSPNSRFELASSMQHFSVGCLVLEPRHFGEIEIAHLHRGHNHIEGLFTRRAHDRRQGLDVREQLDQVLIEPKIL